MNNNTNVGFDVFTALEDASVPAATVGYRAIANSSICSAVFLAHTLLTWDGPTDDTGELTPAGIRQLEFYNSIPARLCRQGELYDVACNRLAQVAISDFDKPMSLEDAVNFAADRAASLAPADLPDEILAAIGMTRAQLKLIDEAEAKRRAQQDRELRASFRARREEISAHVNSYLTTVHDENEVIDQLTVEQHDALFRKVVGKLGEAMQRLLAKRDRYAGALGDVMLISGDIPKVDKAHRAFLRNNPLDQGREIGSEAA